MSVKIKARKVTVKGPKGEITKDLSHMPIEMKCMKMSTLKMKGLYVRIRMWNGGYKQACSVTTFKSLISNMIIGVTEVSLIPFSFLTIIAGDKQKASSEYHLTLLFLVCLWEFVSLFID